MRPIMRYHGGKYRLADWVQTFFPSHHTYVEPFGGAAGVLIQKPRSESEVYNDMDGDVVNVFRVLQCPEKSLELQNKLLITPYARSEFELAYQVSGDPVENARRTLIRAQMGFGSAGATKNRTGFRVDSARKPGNSAHLWAKYPNYISEFCDRLMGVIIENKPAIDVIHNHDRKDTLFFIDPPYLRSERSMSGDCYTHEMTDNDHIKLLESLRSVKGMIVLAGYDNPIYSDFLSDWQRHEKKAIASGNRGGTERTECLWLNASCDRALNKTAQMALGI